ncbi:glutaredoxin family protein [Alteribacter aurantiacus]|uniref:glutaredoxin family protein n=1 Tax=Alteribacter aurantiacus TaxID=254410 RepID=UPI0003F58F62|nr:glutaredoxin family protein [Alteribacter aurantiacus]
MKLTFYTKENCSLCNEALTVLNMLKQEYPFTLDEVDLYQPGNEKELEEYHIRIPVIESENGVVLEEGNVSYFILKQKLNDLFTT